MEHTPSHIRGIFYLLAYAFLIAFIGIFTDHIHGLGSHAVAFIRALLATAFIFCVIIARKEYQAFKPCQIINTTIVGVAHGAMFVCFIGALMKTSVANTVLFTYTAPCFAVLFSKYILKDEIPRSAFGGLFLSLIGLCLIPDPQELTLHSETMIGNLMALGAGVSYAVIMVASKPLSRKASSTYIAFWQNLIATVVLVPFASFDASLTVDAVLQNALPLGGMGILCTGVAFLIFFHGIRLVPTHHTLVMTSLEPVIAILIAAILLGQSISIWTMSGAAFIIIGVYLTTNTTSRAANVIPRSALQSDAYEMAH